jgi:hypothetical protein
VGRVLTISLTIGPASGQSRGAAFCSKKWLVLNPFNFDL